MLRRIGQITAIFILTAAGLLGLSATPALAGTPDDASTVERYYNEHIAIQSTTSTSYIDAVIPRPDALWDGHLVIIDATGLELGQEWTATVEIQLTPKAPKVEFMPYVQVYRFPQIAIE